LSRREITINILGQKKRIKAPPIEDEDVRAIENYITENITKLFKGSEKAIASTIVNNKAILALILNICWDYIKLKKQVEENERELGQRLDEALRLAEFIEKRGR